MGVNKVVYGDATVMDISDTTATASDMAEGVTAYGADGEKMTGTMVTTKSYDALEDKPSINGVELSGDKSAEDYGISASSSLSHLSEKKIALIGDSLIRGNGWLGGYANIISEKCPGANVQNYGVSGARLADVDDGSDAPVISDQLGRLSLFLPDVVIIDGGGNDLLTNAPIGNVKYNSVYDGSYSSAADSLNSIFYNIRNTKPSAKMIFVTWPTYGLTEIVGSLEEQIQLWNVLRLVCEKWSVPIADMTKNANICYMTQGASMYYADVLHFNEAGYRATFPVLEDILIRTFV